METSLSYLGVGEAGSKALHRVGPTAVQVASDETIPAYLLGNISFFYSDGWCCGHTSSRKTASIHSSGVSELNSNLSPDFVIVDVASMIQSIILVPASEYKNSAEKLIMLELKIKV